MIRLIQNAIADLRGALSPRRRVCPVRPWFPEDDALETLSTYENVGEKILDQYRVLNQNPVNIPAAGSPNSVIQLLLENRSRKEFIIVNVGTGALVIGFGFFPTPTNYSIPLQACGVANDGTGGIAISDAWKGAVWCGPAANSIGSQVIVTEIPL